MSEVTLSNETPKSGFKRLSPEPKKLTIPAAQLQAQVAAAAPKEVTPVLKQGWWKGARDWDAHYLVTLPVGWAFDNVLRPEFWAMVAHNLAKKPNTGQHDQVGAVLNIVTEDNNFRGAVIVTAVREKALEVAVFIPPVQFDLAEIPEIETQV